MELLTWFTWTNISCLSPLCRFLCWVGTVRVCKKEYKAISSCKSLTVYLEDQSNRLTCRLKKRKVRVLRIHKGSPLDFERRGWFIWSVVQVMMEGEAGNEKGRGNGEKKMGAEWVRCSVLKREMVVSECTQGRTHIRRWLIRDLTMTTNH